MTWITPPDVTMSAEGGKEVATAEAHSEKQQSAGREERAARYGMFCLVAPDADAARRIADDDGVHFLPTARNDEPQV